MGRIFRVFGGSLCFVLFLTLQGAPTPDTSSDDCTDSEGPIIGLVGCEALTNPDTKWDNIYGVYKNRMFWCDENHRQLCCKTCKEVLQRANTSSSSSVDNQLSTVNTPKISTVQTEAVSITTMPTVQGDKMTYVVDKVSPKINGVEIILDLVLGRAKVNQNIGNIDSIDIKFFKRSR